MPRLKSRRKYQQGIDFVVGYLRAVIEDPKTSSLTKLRCIDRLATIDNIYVVPLGEAGFLPERARPKTKVIEEVGDVEDVETDLDRRARELLEEHRKPEEVSDASELPKD